MLGDITDINDVSSVSLDVIIEEDLRKAVMEARKNETTCVISISS
jgi:hypothetical protein